MIVYTWDIKGVARIEKLDSLGYKFTKLTLFASHEWEYIANVGGKLQGIYTLIDIAKKHKIKLNIITGSTKETPPMLDENMLQNCNIYYHENFWLSCTLAKIETDIINDNLHTNNLYKFICLNFRPHLHRCLIIDLLSKYNLINGNAVSWHQKTNHNLRDPIVNVDYDFKHWKPKILTLTEKTSAFNQFIIPKEYNNSFCQLVVESTIKAPFVSEKTSMPLFYMKPFLVAGCKNFHKILERMGFKLYTEIFDYQFDSIDNLESRFEALVTNLNRINFLSINELTRIQNKLYDKLLFNKYHAIELATTLKNQPDILSELIEETKHQSNGYDIQFNHIFSRYH